MSDKGQPDWALRASLAVIAVAIAAFVIVALRFVH